MSVLLTDMYVFVYWGLPDIFSHFNIFFSSFQSAEKEQKESRSTSVNSVNSPLAVLEWAELEGSQKVKPKNDQGEARAISEAPGQHTLSCCPQNVLLEKPSQVP